jgi:tetratricopeptide (TPR) repeat protein
MAVEPEEGKVPESSKSRIEELERMCFVIMPFGKKQVGDREVDFNAIYKELFEPAIEAVRTPENEPLTPIRTDMDAFSGSINQDMFEYIMYSRLAFADISGFNPNVFYEIGARHSAQESGTVLFRQTGHEIPFDITSIKVFEYDHEPTASADESRDFITRVVSATLKNNRLDSPVRLALRAQWGGGRTEPKMPSEAASSQESHPGEQKRAPDTGMFMRDAEEALRLGDFGQAKFNYWVVLRLDPLNTIARMRLGHVLKKLGKYHDALEEFAILTHLAPDYGEAWKEKGVIEGQIARKIAKNDRPRWLKDGYASLERATQLIPDDFDAWASLGGVLKNVREDPSAARKCYVRAATISDGHPYPLLNALKLEAQETGKLELGSIRGELKKAESLRSAQTSTTPPTDAPWCFFDMAELRLYAGDEAGFLEYIRAGIAASSADWEPGTFLSSLTNGLVEKGIEFAGLPEGVELLEKAVSNLSSKN